MIKMNEIEEQFKRNTSDKDVFVIHECRYKYAYDILMEYWDSLPDDEKPTIHKQLKELGL